MVADGGNFRVPDLGPDSNLAGDNKIDFEIDGACEVLFHESEEEHQYRWGFWVCCNQTFKTIKMATTSSWGGLDETLSSYYNSSSPDGSQSTPASKNIASEGNRRKKLNDRLFALRAVVPRISKMDKASIIKDAIEYIQILHEQERTLQSEIMELESRKLESKNLDFSQERGFMSTERSKKQVFDPSGSRSYPVELLEVCFI